MPRFLHIAASRFERLSPAATKIFCTKDWTHLGEGPINWSNEIREQFQFGQYRNGLRLLLASIYRNHRPRYDAGTLKKMYDSCEFREFFFKAGDRLDFADNELSFIVSEHFFEHLFLDDAIALLRECQRILKPGGVIRTCVPDADLRTYEPPEAPAYPSPRVPWTHHQKHRSRWSIYSFSEALNLTGFQPRGVIYCDKDCNFIQDLPAPPTSEYPLLESHPLVATTEYFRRLPSLVVDGIKR
ncbi:methyltransferase domain-containing protein [Phragmitibacter flavus]|uniref:Methyltransferase domain-containing protein n=1 Tax=Phragmitibacter flavus TaxID=2576071 RepID=A0A5R8KF12_9BACT|nr:methyltransferase domain-containing protein [Phragmitibacter flavus]TLD70893.1 methyltransferase domain-containing protein [Phragmitibacter flavus]